MSNSEYQFEPLRDQHNRSAFSCGTEALDRYLRAQAGQDLRRGLSAVFVLHDTVNDLIAGYYTLSACLVDTDSLPPELARRLPRRPAPATLLSRLAVDLRYQGKGIGKALLADALDRAAAASKDGGAMAVIVDAKDDRARSFYERFGFRRLVDDPCRLYLQMSAIEKAPAKARGKI